jgi:hypothetical protein
MRGKLVQAAVVGNLCQRRANPFVCWSEASFSKLKHEISRFFDSALNAALDAALDAALLDDRLVGQ